MDPGLGATHFRLGRVFSAKRMFTEAIKEIDRPGYPRPFRLAELARVFADAGQRDRAVETLGALEGLMNDGSDRLNSDSLAFVYAALGQHERAFALLDQALAERSPGLVWLKVDPRFDPLRNDNRFTTLLGKLGF